MKMLLTIAAQLLILITANCSSAQTLLAGTVVAIRTPLGIYVGADSKRMAFRGNASVGFICKIRQFQNLFFAYAGLSGDVASGFSVPELAIMAHSNSRRISDTVRNFEQLITGPLAISVGQLRREQPALHQKYLKDRPLLSIVFFGLENEGLVLHTSSFNAKDSADGQPVIDIQRHNCPGDCPDGTTYVFLGEKQAINRFLDANPHYFTVGLVPTIQTLIQLEISDKPELVAPPIDIVRVDMTGTNWIQRKPQCIE
jgi:hypothetical protein